MKYENYYPVIAPLIMCSGIGNGRETASVMAQAATIDALRNGKTLDTPTDQMECACPALRALAISLNDGPYWTNDIERTEYLRPLIPLLLDSKSNIEVTVRRAMKCADYAVRELLPALLADKFPEYVAKLLALEPITDKATANAAVCAADCAAESAVYANMKVKLRDRLIALFHEVAAIQ